MKNKPKLSPCLALSKANLDDTRAFTKIRLPNGSIKRISRGVSNFAWDMVKDKAKNV